jgi:hypothetical protein
MFKVMRSEAREPSSRRRSSRLMNPSASRSFRALRIVFVVRPVIFARVDCEAHDWLRLLAKFAKARRTSLCGAKTP